MAVTTETKERIFELLKKHLKKCCPPMVESSSYDSYDYCIVGNKAVPYGSKKEIIPGMFFCALVHRTDSIAFHYFPCYMNESLLEVAPNLHKCLKGKTCFHFKKLEQVNEKELASLLNEGIKAWKKLGYMK